MLSQQGQRGAWSEFLPREWHRAAWSEFLPRARPAWQEMLPQHWQGPRAPVQELLPEEGPAPVLLTHQGRS